MIEIAAGIFIGGCGLFAAKVAFTWYLEERFWDAWPHKEPRLWPWGKRK